PFHLLGHHGRGRLADGAPAAHETGLLDTAVPHQQLQRDLIAANRVVEVDGDGRLLQRPLVAGTAVVIHDHVPVQIVQLDRIGALKRHGRKTPLRPRGLPPGDPRLLRYCTARSWPARWPAPPATPSPAGRSGAPPGPRCRAGPAPWPSRGDGCRPR